MSGRDDAFGDAVYEAWRRGLNPDAVDRDECDELVRAGYDRFDVAEIVTDRMARRATLASGGKESKGE